MDPIGWFLVTLHGLLGHDKAAAFIGQPAGDRDACVICAYERQPTAEARQAVIRAIGVPG